MIAESNKEQELFDDPQQLQGLRDQLTTFMTNDQNQCSAIFEFIQKEMNCLLEVAMPELFQRVMEGIYAQLTQLKEQSNSQQANTLALSQLAVNMIDYIREKKHQHEGQIETYQNNIDYLKNQIDFLTHKKDAIEGDVEMFRQQLIAAQTQLEEIACIEEKSESHQSSIHNGQNLEEREKRIEQLESELQKIKDQLHCFRVQNIIKRSASTILPASLVQNRSQRFILPQSQGVIHEISQENFEQEMSELRERARELTLENQQLRRELESSKMKPIQVICQSKNNNVSETPTYQIVQPPKEKLFTHIPSISRFQLSQKSLHPVEFSEGRLLLPEPSMEKFHTLSSDVSSKSFEFKLNHFQTGGHVSNLIFLNEERENDEGQMKQTGETENSEELMLKKSIDKKMSQSVGVNTDFVAFSESSPEIIIPDCVCGKMKKSWEFVSESFWSFRDLAVRRRIDGKVMSDRLHR